MPGDGEFDHVATLLEARDRFVCLVRRMRARHEPDLIERGLIAALLREDEVAHVNRVERAAKDADSHGMVPRERSVSTR